MELKYLICDLDNTLYPKHSGLLDQIDQRIDRFLGWKLSLADAAIPELRRQYWQTYGTTLGGMVLCHGIDPEEYLEYAYQIDVTRFIQPDPLLAQVLAELPLSKIIFTNSALEYSERVLAALGVRQAFSAIYDINFCNYLGKPNPSSYLKVLADLDATPAECLLVEDSLVNALGGKQAGMIPVLLSGQPEPEFEWQITSIYELPELYSQITQVLPSNKK